MMYWLMILLVGFACSSYTMAQEQQRQKREDNLFSSALSADLRTPKATIEAATEEVRAMSVNDLLNRIGLTNVESNKYDLNLGSLIAVLSAMPIKEYNLLIDKLGLNDTNYFDVVPIVDNRRSERLLLSAFEAIMNLLFRELKKYKDIVSDNHYTVPPAIETVERVMSINDVMVRLGLVEENPFNLNTDFLTEVFKTMPIEKFNTFVEENLMRTRHSQRTNDDAQKNRLQAFQEIMVYQYSALNELRKSKVSHSPATTDQPVVTVQSNSAEEWNFQHEDQREKLIKRYRALLATCTSISSLCAVIIVGSLIYYAVTS